MRLKTYVYVDGFNLYYGALRGTAYKWLDINSLCRKLLPKNKILEMKYFTARVKARPGDPNQGNRQQLFFRALKTVSGTSIHLGHFMTHETKMMTPAGQYVTVLKTEEKGSDVNLASHLIMDAVQNKFEVAVVISNDTDLLTPIRMVRKICKKSVVILNPHKVPTPKLMREADLVKAIREGAVRTSQFPYELTDKNGTFHCPPSWKTSNKKK